MNTQATMEKVYLSMSSDVTGGSYMADYYCPPKTLAAFLGAEPEDCGDEIQYIFTTSHGIASLYQELETEYTN